MTDVFSLRACGRHLGKSAMTVSRAVKSGRLKECVVRDAQGHLLGISDLALAAKEWAANSDYTDAPQRSASLVSADDAEGSSMSDAATRSKHWEAELKKLKYLKEAGELLAAADVEQRLSDVFSECKTKILGVPNALRQRDPTLSESQLAMITALLRETLFALALGDVAGGA